MPNRYSGQFRMNMPKRDPRAEQEAERRRKSQMDLGTMAALGLPIAGAVAGGALGALGGPAGIVGGMAAGGGLGQAAGQAAGQYFQNQGDSAMDEQRKKEYERMAMMEAMRGFR